MFQLDGVKYQHIINIERASLTEPVICITGPSGSGKTTLLRLLNRLLVPDEGEITFQERALSDWDPVQLRRRVVMLGQTPVLYHETVEENLQIGRRFADKPPASRSQMEQMLERMELPKQLDQWCDKFSGGEKQRLCLARILLMDADVYLLDEPSAALDSDTEERILDYLLHFVQETKKQVILVTHSHQIAARFPQSTIRLVQGRIEREEE